DADRPMILFPLWRRRNPCGNRVTAEESMRSGFRQHPQLGERRHESAGPPSHLYRGIELLLRDPGITVRDYGNVPVTGDPRRRVDGFGPVARSRNAVPLDHLITLVGRPALPLDELPEFVTPAVVVPPRPQDRDRVAAETRVP